MGMKYLPKPEEFHKYWYIDIETDGLWPTNIWLMCASRMDDDKIHSFIGHNEIKRFFDELKGQEVYFVGHNSVSFDVFHIRRILSCGPILSHTLDTLVLSYLYNPALPGGHSLKAWGERLNDHKSEFDDWTKYSPEMDKYCQQDVKLGKKVAKALWKRMGYIGFSETSCQLEHEIRDVINEQERNGWYFDIAGAQSLVSNLRSQQSYLEDIIKVSFPRELKEVGTYRRRFKQDGTDFASFVRHSKEFQLRDNSDGTYSTLEWSDFNIGSPKQRIDRLIRAGYQPVNFTEKDQPKVDEESLISFAEISGKPEVSAIAEWLVIQGRSTMIEGWLNNVNYDDHCMHGRVITCGAASRRMTHNRPNTANIPKAKAKIKYGIECRRLWQARPGRLEVGYDASGLEMRMFAQYLNNESATTLFTTGDPHINNTRNLQLPDEMRDLTVKNGFYAYLYGAGDNKLGKTLKPELQGDEAAEYGKWARKVLEKGTPGLAALVNYIQDEFKHTGGLLKTIDGGFVRCNSKSAALNYKLQSAGAIVMKKAAIIARNVMRERGLESLLIGTIHDEGQHDVAPKDADEVGKVCTQAITQAGLELNFHVPLTGDYKVGRNWAECH